MATLGDKSYSYNFYGLPDSTRLWGTAGVGGYAALTYLNLWGSYIPAPISAFETDGVYWSHDGLTSDNNGKTLDDSAALWFITKTASYACNAVFSADIGDTLSVHYNVNIHNTDAPLAMCAVDNSDGSGGYFRRSPVDRWAYDTTLPCNGTYSAMIYDIVYNNFCLQINATVYDQAAPTTVPQGRALNSVAAYIDTAPDTRDVCVIRPYLYRGAATPRIRTAEYIPPQGLHSTAQGVPLIDTLTDKPIPTSETYLRSLIKDGHDSWRDDAVFTPFVTQLGINLYNASSTPRRYDITSQLEIGFTRPFTVNALKTGAAQIDSGHRITAQYYRCNYDIKTFGDVVYQWENVIYDTVNRVELGNGFDLNLLANNTNIRFYTRLRIIDAKGNTKGKACELAVKHEIAMIGMYFADSVTAAENAELGTAETGVYLPLFNGGVPTGEYVTGDDIPLQPHANANSVADDTFKYRPEMTDSDSGDLQTILHSDKMSGSTKWYSFDELDVYLLSQWLNTTYKPSDIQLTEDFKGTNPADYIVSIRYYPFDVPAGNAEALSIGGVAVSVDGVAVSVNTHSREYGEGSNSFFDLGSFTMQPPYIYGDFRDTYIKLLLYIPWCGFVTLDPAVYCQSPDGTYHTIRAALSIDFATGSCVGMVYRGGTLIDTINGTAGVDVPMTAIANGSYQNAIKQTEIALKNAKAQQLTAYLSTAGALAGGVVSAATGNVAGVAASAAALTGTIAKSEQISNTIEGLQYQLTHTAPAIGDVSTASPFNAALSEQAAKLFIFRPVDLPNADISAYAHTTGHACCRAAKLSSFSGFTVCADVDLSGFEAPAHHKLLIKQALQKGVYL